MHDRVGAPVEVTLRGNVNDKMAEYAEARIEHALLFAHRPVGRAHVVLDYHHDPAVARPADVDVLVDVGGLAVHAEASATTMVEAICEAESRLRGQLVRLQGRALGQRRPQRTAERTP